MKKWNTFRSAAFWTGKALKSANVSLSIILCFLVLFAETAASAWDILFNGAKGLEDAYYFNIALHFGYFIYAAPLICSFAGSGAYCNVHDFGFCRQGMVRAGIGRNCLCVWLSCSISGGIALAGGVLLFAIFQMLVFEPCIDPTSMATVDAWLPVLSAKSGGTLYMMCHVGLAFLFGILWSGIGIMVSVFQPNRYVCYFSPFIICMCATLLLPIGLQPLEMLVQMRWTSCQFWKIFLYSTILYIGSYLLFRHQFRKKMIT